MLPIDNPKNVTFRQEDLERSRLSFFGLKAQTTDAAKAITTVGRVPDVADNWLERKVRLVAQR